MDHETRRQQEADETSYAWDVFRSWTGSGNVAWFRAAYLGHYPDREAFGQELLVDMGADRRLALLPDWLRAYARLDGAAAATDLERAGHFYIYDAPDGGGTYVFDGHGRAG